MISPYWFLLPKDFLGFLARDRNNINNPNIFPWQTSYTTNDELSHEIGDYGYLFMTSRQPDSRSICTAEPYIIQVFYDSTQDNNDNFNPKSTDYIKKDGTTTTDTPQNTSVFNVLQNVFQYTLNYNLDENKSPIDNYFNITNVAFPFPLKYSWFYNPYQFQNDSNYSGTNTINSNLSNLSFTHMPYLWSLWLSEPAQIESPLSFWLNIPLFYQPTFTMPNEGAYFFTIKAYSSGIDNISGVQQTLPKLDFVKPILNAGYLSTATMFGYKDNIGNNSKDPSLFSIPTALKSTPPPTDIKPIEVANYQTTGIIQTKTTPAIVVVSNKVYLPDNYTDIKKSIYKYYYNLTTYYFGSSLTIFASNTAQSNYFPEGYIIEPIFNSNDTIQAIAQYKQYFLLMGEQEVHQISTINPLILIKDPTSLASQKINVNTGIIATKTIASQGSFLLYLDSDFALQKVIIADAVSSNLNIQRADYNVNNALSYLKTYMLNWKKKWNKKNSEIPIKAVFYKQKYIVMAPQKPDTPELLANPPERFTKFDLWIFDIRLTDMSKDQIKPVLYQWSGDILDNLVDIGVTEQNIFYIFTKRGRFLYNENATIFKDSIVNDQGQITPTDYQVAIETKGFNFTSYDEVQMFKKLYLTLSTQDTTVNPLNFFLSEFDGKADTIIPLTFQISDRLLDEHNKPFAVPPKFSNKNVQLINLMWNQNLQTRAWGFMTGWLSSTNTVLEDITIFSRPRNPRQTLKF